MKGLWRHPRTGLPYYRTRRGGKTALVPLPADLAEDHPDFIAAWAEAARGAKVEKPAAGTLASTWNAALASDSFHSYSSGYRAIIEREAGRITEKAGKVKAAAIATRHVRADVMQAENPEARLKAWRVWAAICLPMGWIIEDPTHGIKKPRRAPSTGHPTWTRTEIKAFRNAYRIGTTARAVMELTYWTGARIGDVVMIGPQHVEKDGVLCFRQSKTGDMAYVPWSCSLPDWAAHMEEDRELCKEAVAHLSGGLTFLQTNRKRPRSHKSAGQDISAACRAIGLERSAHGLRKARAVALADAGATTSQIGAWTGHRSLSEIAHYTREWDRRSAVRGTRTERELETTTDQIGNQARKAPK
ncbi:tyrosine-type recombinase/integrase [Mameliella alba]|uniref:tyrosine-type recombinase/integrase n=1 Tax=Mameliella alba TaxID=561184 RepID=UPI00111234A0|nr:tyrosine-type recombinase/integrase [Mameliella alba]